MNDVALSLAGLLAAAAPEIEDMRQSISLGLALGAQRSLVVQLREEAAAQPDEIITPRPT